MPIAVIKPRNDRDHNAAEPKKLKQRQKFHSSTGHLLELICKDSADPLMWLVGPPESTRFKRHKRDVITMSESEIQTALRGARPGGGSVGGAVARSAVGISGKPADRKHTVNSSRFHCGTAPVAAR